MLIVQSEIAVSGLPALPAESASDGGDAAFLQLLGAAMGAADPASSPARLTPDPKPAGNVLALVQPRDPNCDGPSRDRAPAEAAPSLTLAAGSSPAEVAEAAGTGGSSVPSVLLRDHLDLSVRIAPGGEAPSEPDEPANGSAGASPPDRPRSISPDRLVPGEDRNEPSGLDAANLCGRPQSAICNLQSAICMDPSGDPAGVVVAVASLAGGMATPAVVVPVSAGAAVPSVVPAERARAGGDPIPGLISGEADAFAASAARPGGVRDAAAITGSFHLGGKPLADSSATPAVEGGSSWANAALPPIRAGSVGNAAAVPAEPGSAALAAAVPDGGTDPRPVGAARTAASPPIAEGPQAQPPNPLSQGYRRATGGPPLSQGERRAVPGPAGRSETPRRADVLEAIAADAAAVSSPLALLDLAAPVETLIRDPAGTPEAPRSGTRPAGSPAAASPSDRPFATAPAAPLPPAAHGSTTGVGPAYGLEQTPLAGTPTGSGVAPALPQAWVQAPAILEGAHPQDDAVALSLAARLVPTDAAHRAGGGEDPSGAAAEAPAGEGGEDAIFPGGGPTASAAFPGTGTQAAEARRNRFSVLRGTRPLHSLLREPPASLPGAASAVEGSARAAEAFGDAALAATETPSGHADPGERNTSTGSGASEANPAVAAPAAPGGSGATIMGAVAGRADESPAPAALPLDGVGHQIVTHARVRLRGDGGSVEMHLDPPALGRVRLHVALHDGALTAYLGTETAAAHQVLESQAGALRAALEESGIPVQSVQVGLDLSLGNPGGHQAEPRHGDPAPALAGDRPEPLPRPADKMRRPRALERQAGVDYLA